MRKLRRIGVPLGLTVALVVGTASPALAAPPSNDTFGGAIEITTTPYDVTVDTTEATTDADDVATNPLCGAPATEKSVWYKVTPAEAGVYLVDVSSSNYPAGVTVVTGSPEAGFELQTCGPGTVVFEAQPGTTYYILAFDDGSAGAPFGGTLVFHVELAPPPPQVDFTVNNRGTYTPSSGIAHISGTYVCTGDAEFAFITGELQQLVGRGIVVGYIDISLVCDGNTYPWTYDVEPYYKGTKFGGGNSVAFTYGVGCGAFLCSETYKETNIKLRKEPKPKPTAV